MTGRSRGSTRTSTRKITGATLCFIPASCVQNTRRAVRVLGQPARMRRVRVAVIFPFVLPAKTDAWDLVLTRTGTSCACVIRLSLLVQSYSHLT
eukprot:scaffold274908_cov22-Prasinocladus_malaysianus.AAC.1